jgi:RNA polymerase sigma-70 factor, ECF subfamily
MKAKTEELWHKYGAEVRRFVRGKLGNRFESDDVMQDIFLKVHEQVHNVNDGDKMKQWLFAVARNAVNDHFRRNNRKTLPLRELPAEEAHEPGMFSRFRNCLADFLRDLTPESRTALIAADIKRVDQLKLAKELNVNYSTLKSRVQRARQALRKKITDCCSIVHDRYGAIVDFQPGRSCACRN